MTITVGFLLLLLYLTLFLKSHFYLTFVYYRIIYDGTIVGELHLHDASECFISRLPLVATNSFSFRFFEDECLQSSFLDQMSREVLDAQFPTVRFVPDGKLNRPIKASRLGMELKSGTDAFVMNLEKLTSTILSVAKEVMLSSVIVPDLSMRVLKIFRAWRFRIEPKSGTEAFVMNLEKLTSTILSVAKEVMLSILKRALNVPYPGSHSYLPKCFVLNSFKMNAFKVRLLTRCSVKYCKPSFPLLEFLEQQASGSLSSRQDSGSVASSSGLLTVSEKTATKTKIDKEIRPSSRSKENVSTKKKQFSKISDEEFSEGSDGLIADLTELKQRRKSTSQGNTASQAEGSSQKETGTDNVSTRFYTYFDNQSRSDEKFEDIASSSQQEDLPKSDASSNLTRNLQETILTDDKCINEPVTDEDVSQITAKLPKIKITEFLEQQASGSLSSRQDSGSVASSSGLLTVSEKTATKTKIDKEFRPSSRSKENVSTKKKQFSKISEEEFSEGSDGLIADLTELKQRRKSTSQVLKTHLEFNTKYKIILLKAVLKVAACSLE
ncbi:hypothetical protein C0J52_25373 [Blattella germanica]|nr:hypothetical protein C0J52_25373 [Blattella germanica]